jgi:cholest-4-en-3-one 26-monooxygenase
VTELDLGNPAFYVNGFPHELFARLRRENPVAWSAEPADGLFPGGPGFWAVTRHADVVAAGKLPDVFSSSAGGTFIRDMPPNLLREARKAMLNQDPPEHSKQRRIVSKAFTPRVARGMQESMERHAHAVVDALAGDDELDLVDRFSAEMPVLVLADLLGVPSGDRRLLYDWTNQMVGGGDPAAISNPESYAKAFLELFTYAAELTKQKRANPTDDVWSMVVNAEVDGDRLDDEALRRFFQLLVIAGNETTRNLLTGFVLLMSEHPDQLRLLRDHPSLLSPAIEEVLRYHSPVTQFRRTAVQDFELGGQLIEAGDKVVLCYASANRDEDVFVDPHRFDVTRTENPHVAFGIGQHFCLGNAVARAEARAILPIFYERFGTIEVTGEAVLQRSNFINGIVKLPVRLSTRTEVNA